MQVKTVQCANVGKLTSLNFLVKYTCLNFKEKQPTRLMVLITVYLSVLYCEFVINI